MYCVSLSFPWIDLSPLTGIISTLSGPFTGFDDTPYQHIARKRCGWNPLDRHWHTIYLSEARSEIWSVTRRKGEETCIGIISSFCALRCASKQAKHNLCNWKVPHREASSHFSQARRPSATATAENHIWQAINKRASSCGGQPLRHMSLWWHVFVWHLL